jgi:hypothetical protein
LTPPSWYWRTSSAPSFEQNKDKVIGDNTQTYIAEFLNGTTD